MSTGLRAVEIASIRVRDLDLASGYLAASIHKSKLDDAMPITVELDRAMRDWLVNCRDEIGRPLDPEAFLVPARYAPKWRDDVMTLGELRPDRMLTKPHSIAQRALRHIGYCDTRGLGVHTVRRSVARMVFERAINEGEDGALQVTASLLHHKNVATNKLYIGLNRDRRKRDELLRRRSLFPAPAPNVVTIRQNS